eukprot:CAMPEP_0202884852 /NCGR_PEP_ID=MMETSP1391-20130828/41356_1 /ASSEMBLY_ACC=CAM_ASM_000867 /TAXON_ID=1034604 /ORGANISM="Chlamydomonas leiostraca, Strain SAG 11-49" /LENGTH=185 /DNA_ID=CAMNT_0049568085 /DNA_START=9 /DNA_END=566 /DNA_ORIENTATION=+
MGSLVMRTVRALYVRVSDPQIADRLASSVSSSTSCLESIARTKAPLWGSQGFFRGFSAAAQPATQQQQGSASGDGLVIDNSAVERLQQLAKERGDQGLFLRVEVEGGGCSGFQYKFALDTKMTPTDVVFEKAGSKVVTDSVSLEFLKGAKLEYEDSLMRSAFVISTNPNSEATCGCGSSFTAKMK